jgi:hypothetical protein
MTKNSTSLREQRLIEGIEFATVGIDQHAIAGGEEKRRAAITLHADRDRGAAGAVDTRAGVAHLQPAHAVQPVVEVMLHDEPTLRRLLDEVRERQQQRAFAVPDLQVERRGVAHDHLHRREGERGVATVLAADLRERSVSGGLQSGIHHQRPRTGGAGGFDVYAHDVGRDGLHLDHLLTVRVAEKLRLQRRQRAEQGGGDEEN